MQYILQPGQTAKLLHLCVLFNV